MEWRDEGIVLGARRHGETSAILEVMTAAHGRHLGLVRGGRSRRLQPVLQPGNAVALHWHARLDEHLGVFTVEPLALNSGRFFDAACAIHGVQLAAAHLRHLPERDPHASLYEALGLLIGHLSEPLPSAEILVRFELLLLEELGFGLDLERCALTGEPLDLAFVSPKTGRAVSAAAGRPWADKLLVLPPFLRAGSGMRADIETAALAFRLTGHFLARHVWEPRGQEPPPARTGFLAALAKSANAAKEGDAA